MHRDLCDLPPEILNYIFGFLDSSSLLRISLASRQCKLESDSYKFKVVRLFFHTAEDLRLSIVRSTSLLTTAAAFKHVQHVKVLETDESDGGGRNTQGSRRRICSWDSESAKERIFSESHWLDLDHLLSTLPSLRDLSWVTKERVSLAVLRRLNAVNARLHLYGFHLVSPHHEPLGVEDLEIATAPCLYSLSMIHLDNPKLVSVILDMVAAAAPNLKEVYFRSVPPPGALHWPQPPPFPSNLWPMGLILRKSLGSLSVLQLDSVVDLQRCGDYTDLSALRTLTCAWLKPEELAWMSSFRFASLESFTLWESHPSFQQQGAVEAFILSLPRIRQLLLGHTYSEASLSRIVRHCGLRLQKLYCVNSFVKMDFVNQLPISVDELGLGVYRWAGSSLEAAFYRKLRLLSLSEVHLRIRSFQTVQNDASYASLWDFEPMEVCHISPELDRAYLAMRDLAFDERLARSIFNAIQPSERLSLVVDPTLDERFAPSLFRPGLSSLLNNISLSWDCVQKSDGCRVTEMEHHGGLYLSREVDATVQSKYAPAIQLAWPASRYKPFEDAWSSFPPLDLSDEVSNTKQPTVKLPHG